jgi:hypothetical protein
MRHLLGLTALLLAASPAAARGLEAAPGVRPVSARLSVDAVEYDGTPALHVRDNPGAPGQCCLVPLDIRDFHDGTIEAMVAGRPRDDASEGARGFVGIAFRVQGDGARYEAFYLRPTNGRADDQLRRNHATQYISEPEFPWERLRREAPGVYESYADLEPGIWTHVRIEVRGNRAWLYVNRSRQPVLIVNDLKLGADAGGGIALWVGSETEAHFADVSVTPPE